MRGRRPTAKRGDASIKVRDLFALDEFALGVAAGAFLGRCGSLWWAFNELALGVLAGRGECWAQCDEAAQRERGCKFLHKSTPMGAEHHCPQPRLEHISNICAVK